LYYACLYAAKISKSFVKTRYFASFVHQDCVISYILEHYDCVILHISVVKIALFYVFWGIATALFYIVRSFFCIFRLSFCGILVVPYKYFYPHVM